jgi:hypothetical protein
VKLGGALKIGGCAQVNRGQSPGFHLAGYDRGLPDIQRLVENPLSINGLSPLIGMWRGRDAGGATWNSVDRVPVSLTLTGAGADPVQV